MKEQFSFIMQKLSEASGFYCNCNSNDTVAALEQDGWQINCMYNNIDNAIIMQIGVGIVPAHNKAEFFETLMFWNNGLNFTNSFSFAVDEHNELVTFQTLFYLDNMTMLDLENCVAYFIENAMKSITDVDELTKKLALL